MFLDRVIRLGENLGDRESCRLPKNLYVTQKNTTLLSLPTIVSNNNYSATVAIQCDVLWSLMRGYSSGQQPISALSPRVQRVLMSSLVASAIGEKKQQFLTEVN